MEDTPHRQNLERLTDASRAQYRAPLEIEFLLRFADAGHNAGYTSDEIEARTLQLSRRLGIDAAQVSATPTLIELSVGSIEHQRTFTLRERPATVDLDAISRLDDLTLRILEDELAPAAALDALAAITSDPLRRPWPVMLAAYALAGAALTPVLGGGPRDAVAGAIAGLMAGSVSLATDRTPRAEPIAAPVAAIAASFTAATLVHLGLKASPDIVTLAAIVPLLPGMSLTIGMLELSTQHLQSGIANTGNAVVQLIGIVFGVAIGDSVATTWFGSIPHPKPDQSFTNIHLAAAAVAGIAFTVTLRAGWRSAPVMCSACVLALAANAAGAALVGPQAGVFVAAVAVGVTGSRAGTRLRQSSLVFIVPGILMLVPGSAGYHSILRLLSGETVSGINAGVTTFVTAMSIAYGLLVSIIIAPRRLG
jgi:uncharacterized membrane protein YjjP (DUF1212 family)